MKKTIILALTLLLLIGCRHNRAVSPRLVELDSLIATAPDSAAALLSAIPPDSLADGENRAYHANFSGEDFWKNRTMTRMATLSEK